MVCITGQGASQWPRPRSDERWVHPWPGQLCPWGEAPAPGDSSPRAGQVEAEVHTAKRQQATSSPPARRLHRRLEPLSCLPPPSRLLPLGPSCLPHRPTPRALLPQLCPGPTQAPPGCKAKLAASRGRTRAFMVAGSEGRACRGRGPFLSHPRRRPAGSFSTITETAVP